LGEFEAAFRVSSSGDYSGNKVSMEIVFFVVMGGYAVRPIGFYGHPVTLTPRGFVILYMYWFWWDKPLDVRYPIFLDLQQQLAEEIYSSLKVRDDDRPLPLNHRLNLAVCKPYFSEITVEHPQDSGRDKTNRQAPLTHTENDGSAIGKATICPTCLHIYRLENNRVSSRFRRVWKDSTEGEATWKINHLFPFLLVTLCTGWYKTFVLWPPAREDIIDLEIKLFCLARSRGRAEAAPSFKHSPNDLGGGGTGDRQPICVRARMVQSKGNFQGGLEDANGNASFETFIILCFLSILYGGAHCRAWNTHLPTQVEHTLSYSN
jgi:hypothetical protein